MQSLICCRCGKPATIGEHDDAIGSFLACSDECHAAELACRTENYQDEVSGVYDRKRERIAAIRAGEIEHPGYVQIEGEPLDCRIEHDRFPDGSPTMRIIVGVDLGAPGGDQSAVATTRGAKLEALTLTGMVLSPLDVALARMEGCGAERLT